MKHRKLIKEVESYCWWLERHGTRHDIYTTGTQKEEIPRHPDVNEMTAKDIIKRVKKNPGRK